MKDTIGSASHADKMAEIWRLRSINAVLLTALKAILDQAVYSQGLSPDQRLNNIHDIAKGAIAAVPE